MSEKIYPVSEAWASRGYVNAEKYESLYKSSVTDNEGFWGRTASGSTGSRTTPRSRTSPTSPAM